MVVQRTKGAILDGRLRAETRLPAARNFAAQYEVSRGTMVSVFERLQCWAGHALQGGARVRSRSWLGTEDTSGLLKNGLGSADSEKAAVAAGVEALGLYRFTLKRPDPEGLLPAFAAFHEAEIHAGLVRLARALERARPSLMLVHGGKTPANVAGRIGRDTP